jgi:4-carboxymuconolactone decarboxylase
MAISKKAQRNHDALFANQKSALVETDPELVEVFDNWAFDEVLAESVLDTRTRLIRRWRQATHLQQFDGDLR